MFTHPIDAAAREDTGMDPPSEGESLPIPANQPRQLQQTISLKSCLCLGQNPNRLTNRRHLPPQMNITTLYFHLIPTSNVDGRILVVPQSAANKDMQLAYKNLCVQRRYEKASHILPSVVGSTNPKTMHQFGSDSEYNIWSEPDRKSKNGWRSGLTSRPCNLQRM